MSEQPLKIIVSDALPPGVILLVPTHPPTAEELQEMRALMARGWVELSAFVEVRARTSAAIKNAT